MWITKRRSTNQMLSELAKSRHFTEHAASRPSDLASRNERIFSAVSCDWASSWYSSIVKWCQKYEHKAAKSMPTTMHVPFKRTFYSILICKNRVETNESNRRRRRLDRSKISPYFFCSRLHTPLHTRVLCTKLVLKRLRQRQQRQFSFPFFYGYWM